MQLSYKHVGSFPHVFLLSTKTDDWMKDCAILLRWCQENVATGDWKQGYAYGGDHYEFKFRHDADAFKFRMMFCED